MKFDVIFQGIIRLIAVLIILYATYQIGGENWFLLACGLWLAIPKKYMID